MYKCRDDCERCETVIENINQNRWYHYSDDLLDRNLDKHCRELTEIFKGGKDVGGKPNNVLWASAGNWMINPYHDTYHEPGEELEIFRCAQICPKEEATIMRVSTKEDFLVFESNYVKRKMKPDWEKVFEEFDAVQFDFCKTREIGLKSSSWHNSFDVESLIIRNPEMFMYKIVDVLL